MDEGVLVETCALQVEDYVISFQYCLIDVGVMGFVIKSCNIKWFRGFSPV